MSVRIVITFGMIVTVTIFSFPMATAYSCPEENVDFNGNDILVLPGQITCHVPGVKTWQSCGKLLKSNLLSF